MESRILLFVILQFAPSSCVLNLRCLCDLHFRTHAPQCFRGHCGGEDQDVICTTTIVLPEVPDGEVIFVSTCLQIAFNDWRAACSLPTNRCCFTDMCNSAFHGNNSAFQIFNTPTTEQLLDNTSSILSENSSTEYTQQASEGEEFSSTHQIETKDFLSSTTQNSVNSSEQTTVSGDLLSLVTVTATICIIILFFSVILILGVAALAYYYLIARTDKVSEKKQQREQVPGHSTIIPTFSKSNYTAHSAFFHASDRIISPEICTGSTSTIV